ncbi:MAG TPA: hypothetical protein VF698_12440 [Thermoanaerobaculia bacterium]
MLTATFLAALIVVASSDGSHVTLVDAETLAVAGTVAVGSKPHEIALSSDHRIAWVGNTDGTITAVDLQHRRAMRTIPLTDCKGEHDLRASRDGQKLWIGCARSKVILELDTLSRQTIARHDIKAEGAWILAASPDESLLVTANLEGGSLSFLDEKRDARVIATAPGEIALDIAPDGTVWAGNSETGAVVLFAKDGTRLRSVPGMKGPVRIRFTPGGRYAVINDAPRKALVLVDTKTLEVAKTIELPAEGKVIAVSPDGKRIAASSPDTNQLFIADIASGKVVKSIPIAAKPDGVVWAGVPATPPASVTATIPAKDLVPEGIAYDPVTKRFFVGSTWRRKIVAIDAKGAARDFFNGAADDGVWGFVGMRVDAKRRRLWAIHSHAGADMPMVRMNAADEGRTGVLEFDVDSGRLVRRYELQPRGSFLNDLVLASNGDLYLTNTMDHTIYTIPRGGELQAFVRLDPYQWPNGIDLTPDGTRLVVATYGNLITIDLRDKTKRVVTMPPGVTFRMSDGLYVHGNSVIGVQPWAAAHEVERYVVDRGFTKVLRTEPLVSAHPLFEQPTTGVIVGNRLHLIANSHLQTFRALHAAQKHDTLEGMRELTILSAPLQ